MKIMYMIMFFSWHLQAMHSEIDKCCICLETLPPGWPDKISIMCDLNKNINHEYCFECVKNQKQCALCRTEFGSSATALIEAASLYKKNGSKPQTCRDIIALFQKKMDSLEVQVKNVKDEFQQKKYELLLDRVRLKQKYRNEAQQEKCIYVSIIVLLAINIIKSYNTQCDSF